VPLSQNPFQHHTPGTPGRTPQALHRPSHPKQLGRNLRSVRIPGIPKASLTSLVIDLVPRIPKGSPHHVQISNHNPSQDE
jgi:hypothetical protein